MRTYGHVSNGGFVDPACRQWLNSVDPFSGEAWARVARGDADEAVRANNLRAAN